MGTFGEAIGNLDFFNLMGILYDNSYYKYIFPFLLTYALMFSVLPIIEIFRGDKKKPIRVIISLIISLCAVYFPLGVNELTLGDYMMMLFPNISAISIGILGFYIVGAMFGKNFFETLFNKKYSAYMFLTVVVIGLGSVIFYFGIASGWWSDYGVSQTLYWNMIIGIALLILGIVFMFIDGFKLLALIFFTVFYIFVYYYGEDVTIFQYFLDPAVLIMILVFIVVSWMNQLPKDQKIEKLKEEIKKYKDDYKKDYGEAYDRKKFNANGNQIKAIDHQGIMDREDELKKLEK